MRFKKKKIFRMKLRLLALAMAAGLPFMQGIMPATSYANSATSIIGALGLGMKINSSTKYNYALPKDLTAAIVCRATNDAAQNPVQGRTGTYACTVLKLKHDSRYIFPTGYTTGSMSYTAGVSTTTLQLGYTEITGYNNGKPVTENGSIPITIRAEAASNASTAIGGSGGNLDGGWDNKGWLGGSSGLGDGDGNVEVYPGGLPDLSGGEGSKPKGWDSSLSGTCSDGSSFCPEESGPDEDPFHTRRPNEDGSLNPPNEGEVNLTDNGTGQGDLGGSDGLSTTPGNKTWTDQTDDGRSDPNYGDIINGMLGDTGGDSYNSPNMDWSTSPGGEPGENDLDGYFGSIEDAGPLPDGMTVDGIEDADEPSDIPSDDGYGNNQAYIEDGGRGQGNSSNPLLGDYDHMPGAYQDALSVLDPGAKQEKPNGAADGIFGDMGDADSLKDKISNFLGNDKTGADGRKGPSDQELYGYAKDILLSSGYTASDIASGKNYDEGSAYTEPVAAWDMNRITTLLRRKKISLTNPADAPTKEESNKGSALSRVSKASLTSPKAKALNGEK